eukprot:TRINITY_DN4051_c0_g1_i1.p1 TRINITY_DN4051_c0_g1~~TRINITY_DN4051_c0_g1_i1.p1  ORF type:complete len:111 (-),score=12.80 TRINITY_DN4051_c0_g1_i1:24-356(-)
MQVRPVRLPREHHQQHIAPSLDLQFISWVHVRLGLLPDFDLVPHQDVIHLLATLTQLHEAQLLVLAMQVPPRGQQLDPCTCPCLLYTSDAADEEDSVDLGGRRITKKKKN